MNASADRGGRHYAPPLFVERSEYASPAELYKDPFLKASEKEMLSETLRTFDRARELHGGPLVINSGRRSLAHQLELKEAGFRTASFSPHCFGAALDVKVPQGWTDEDLASLIYDAAERLALPAPRVGMLDYRKAPKDPEQPATRFQLADGKFSSTFVHFDFVFLLKGYIEGVPASIWNSWREGVSW